MCDLDLSRADVPRRKRWLWVFPLAAALALLGWSLPRLVALVPQAVAAHRQAEVLSLQQQLLTLRLRLAAQADLAAENDALRTLLGSERLPDGHWAPARITARWDDTLQLSGQYPLGAPVLAAEGRLIGAVTAHTTAHSTVTRAGVGGGALACAEGVLRWQDDVLYLTELPRHTVLDTGTLIATTDGCWAGLTACAPEPDATGLTVRVALTDTGQWTAARVFVRQDL